MQEENRELAVKTCELQPQFEELKSSLRRKSTEVDELRDSYARKYEELSECMHDSDSFVSQTVLCVCEKKFIHRKWIFVCLYWVVGSGWHRIACYLS